MLEAVGSDGGFETTSVWHGNKKQWSLFLRGTEKNSYRCTHKQDEEK